MSFAHPWVLLGLWSAPILGWWLYAIYSRGRSPAPFLNGVMALRLAPPVKTWRFQIQSVLILAGLALSLFATARPRWGEREELVVEKGRDVVVAVDVSRSMLARDVRPNRLQRAKADVMDLLRSLHGDRAALVAFRGNAVALCPLTTDYAYLEHALEGLDPDSAPRGSTDIGDAIEKSMALFDASGGGHRAIVLITDGEDLAGRALAVAEHAKQFGAAIFTVGLGDPAGATIPANGQEGGDPIKYQGSEVISKMEGAALQKIAEITGGAYVPVGVRNVNLGVLYSEHLAKLAARDIEETLLRRHIERYQWFLFPAALALLGAACLSRGRPASGRPSVASEKKTDRFAGASLALAMCFVFGATASAQTNAPAPGTSKQAPARAVAASAASETNAPVVLKQAIPPGREGARIAQALYNKGRYREAAEAYRAAAAGQAPALQNTFLFNAGCAAYAAGDFQSAVGFFRGLDAGAPSQEQASDIRHNLGCSLVKLAEQPSIATNPLESALFKVGALEQAGAAFQGALRSSAASEAARDNLAVVTQSLALAREQARVAGLMARYGNQPAPALADQLLLAQRALLAKLPATLTNAVPGRIKLFEELAHEQAQNADIIMPLKSTLLAAGQQQGMNADQLSEFAQHLDALEKTMRDAGLKLRDFDETGAPDLARSEKGVYLVWKGVVSHPLLLREDLLRQTNAIVATRLSSTASTPESLKELCENQAEAQSLTELFAERFAQDYPENTNAAQQAVFSTPATNDAAAATNEPAMTPEKRARILELSGQASKAQVSALQSLQAAEFARALEQEKIAHAKLKEIEDLLPKDKNQQQQNQQQQNQQDQKQDQQQDQKQDQQKEPEQSQDQQQQKPEEQQAEPKQAENESKQQHDMAEERAREILLKAIQREKEHAEEKRRQDQIPMSPADRDW